MDDEIEKIYFAIISGNIVRKKYTKFIREQFSIECVYKQNSENEKNSYLIQSLRKKLKLDKIEETIEIKNIEKIKTIGLNS